MTVLRPASDADVDTCLVIQRASTTVGYAHIFDQVLYPFPERAIRDEWVSRFASQTEVTIATVADSAVGVIGSSVNRLEALFVVPEQWGRGVADQLHDHALAQIAAGSHRHAVLEVLADNPRARAFYERRGWHLALGATTAPWPPFPDLVRYTRSI